MSRIDLQVPFPEKDEAKLLGARWDSDKKVWYVPEGVAPAPFKKWFPVSTSVNIKAANYYIAETTKSCWKCDAPTRVYGFLLPAGYETIEQIDDADMEFDSSEAHQAWLDSDESSEWIKHDEPTIIHYIDYLPNAVQANIRAQTSHYRIDFSKTTQSSYWMNHCERCGMKQGDFEMFCEPQGAFMPIYEVDASRIVLYVVNEPFEASVGGFSFGVDFFEQIQRV